jgi:plastocyanin
VHGTKPGEGLIADTLGVNMKALLVAALLAAAVPVQAQAPQPVTVSVTMENFKFTPNALQLRAGVPTVLHLTNTASGGHNFTAPEFFAAARIASASQSTVHNGVVEVPKHSSVEVVLVPAAGQYPLKCSHTLHAAFGMRGSITVR